MKEQPLDHPYYQERLAALTAWAETGAYREILGRRVEPSAGQLIEVTAIRAYGLAPDGQSADPYVVATDGERPLLRTRYAAAVRDAQWRGFGPAGPRVDQPRAFRDGQPLYFEVWDADYGDDALIGGFVIYPRGPDARPDEDGDRLAEYTAPIRWDWRDPRPVARPGHAWVRVRFTRRPGGADEAVGAKR